MPTLQSPARFVQTTVGALCIDELLAFHLLRCRCEVQRLPETVSA